MNNILKLAVMVLVLLISSCDNGTDPGQNKPEVVYRNTFDSIEDISGWEGSESCQAVEIADPYLNYIRKAMLIGGGCIQPAAMFRIVAKARGNYSISSVAKSADSISVGTIKLSRDLSDTDTEKALIVVNDTDWNYLRSDRSIYFDKGDTIFVELYIGGIVANYMYLDELRIERR